MSEVYCGPAPTPSTLMAAWNPDLAALALCTALVAAFALHGRQDRKLPMAGAVAVTALLFLSPLCGLSAALFSARAVHHLLLVAAAAPMLALAFPASGVSARIGIGWVAVGYAVIFWLWHAPAVYAVAVVQPVLYWTMQLTLLGSAAWFWRRVLCPAEETGGVLLALLGTIVQMGMLGALLTFAATPLYEPHLATTIPFGMSPLQDQQLAGIIMWVPAALPYLAAALFRAWPLLGPSGGSARWSG